MGSPFHTPDLKKPEDYQYIGKASSKAWIFEEKVTGKPIYSIDDELEGMVYAIVIAMSLHVQAKRERVLILTQSSGLPGVIEM